MVPCPDLLVEVGGESPVVAGVEAHQHGGPVLLRLPAPLNSKPVKTTNSAYPVPLCEPALLVCLLPCPASNPPPPGFWPDSDLVRERERLRTGSSAPPPAPPFVTAPPPTKNTHLNFENI